MTTSEIYPEDKGRKSQEFDNNWQEVFETPSDRFTTPTINEVITRAGSWELPKEYVTVVRVQNPKTYKIVEKCFKRVSAANRFVLNQEGGGNLVTAYNQDELYSSIGFEDDSELE